MDLPESAPSDPFDDDLGTPQREWTRDGDVYYCSPPLATLKVWNNGEGWEFSVEHWIPYGPEEGLEIRITPNCLFIYSSNAAEVAEDTYARLDGWLMWEAERRAAGDPERHDGFGDSGIAV